MTLTVDKKTYYVVQADVFDGLGNVTRTRFMEIKTNVGLPNSFFQFYHSSRDGNPQISINESGLKSLIPFCPFKR